VGVGWGFGGANPSEPPANPQPTPSQPPIKYNQMMENKSVKTTGIISRLKLILRKMLTFVFNCEIIHIFAGW